jgi:hypothetical protein
MFPIISKFANACFDFVSVFNDRLYFLCRRITRRKGEIQGRKRRTRHDIKRIIGLLKTHYYWWWQQQQQQQQTSFF